MIHTLHQRKKLSCNFVANGLKKPLKAGVLGLKSESIEKHDFFVIFKPKSIVDIYCSFKK